MQSSAVCAEMRAARVARLFFLFQPMILLFCGVVFAVAVVVVVSWTPLGLCARVSILVRLFFRRSCPENEVK